MRRPLPPTYLLVALLALAALHPKKPRCTASSAQYEAYAARVGRWLGRRIA